MLTPYRGIIYSAHHRTVRCTSPATEPAFHVQREIHPGMCARLADNAWRMVQDRRVIGASRIGYVEAPVQRTRHRCTPAGDSRFVNQHPLITDQEPRPHRPGFFAFQRLSQIQIVAPIPHQVAWWGTDGPLAQRKSTSFAPRGSAVRARRGPPFCRRGAPRPEASSPRSSRIGIGPSVTPTGSCFPSARTRVDHGVVVQRQDTALAERRSRFKSARFHHITAGLLEIDPVWPHKPSRGVQFPHPLPWACRPTAGHPPRTRKTPVRIRPGPPAGRASHVRGHRARRSRAEL